MIHPTRFKSVTAASMVRWRQDPESMIEEEYPSEDFEYMEVGPSPPVIRLILKLYSKNFITNLPL